MCSIAIGLTLLSTVVGAAGTMAQASAQAEASKYNAEIAEMNATLAERNAKDALEAGALEEQAKRTELAQLQGQQRAAMAASGVDLTFGSPLDTMVDSAVIGELDALTIRQNAYRKNYDYRVEAVNQRAGATLHEMEADAAMTGGAISAAGTILGGVGKAYQSYTQPTIGTIA